MPSLRALRAARLLSIRGLAQRAQVAPSTIYLIEAGRVTPGPLSIRLLASALNVAPVAVDEFRQALEWAPQPSRLRTDR
jgi:transcriptional regulator with XRE-family HTH domain